MPASVMSFFPNFDQNLRLLKLALEMNVSLVEAEIRAASNGFDLIKQGCDAGLGNARRSLPFLPMKLETSSRLLDCCEQESDKLLSIMKRDCLGTLNAIRQERAGAMEFVRFFSETPPAQEWDMSEGPVKILLDLPGLRLLDISRETNHRIANYTVVFAPRAGHNSNVVERVSCFMRDHGLTRLAVVEQKCADEVPLFVNGKRHLEDFDSQVSQYTQILECLKNITGHPSHLVAVCQPGPLLMSTLILNPHLAKTFGSAGSPMDTEAERGFLTDFSRTMGEHFIDFLVRAFGHRVPRGKTGAGREAFDGRAHVLGFYFLGKDQHLRNFRKLLNDLKSGNKEGAERQKVFYRWYNTVNHLPADFIRDTYKRIFVRNELARGVLTVHGRRIGLKDYPSSVPIWALGGDRDDIAPLLQATGHMGQIHSVPDEHKLSLSCPAGHMGLFRASEILKNYYSRIADFILARSDQVQAEERPAADARSCVAQS